MNLNTGCSVVFTVDGHFLCESGRDIVRWFRFGLPVLSVSAACLPLRAAERVLPRCRRRPILHHGDRQRSGPAVRWTGPRREISPAQGFCCAATITSCSETAIHRPRPGSGKTARPRGCRHSAPSRACNSGVAGRLGHQGPTAAPPGRAPACNKAREPPHRRGPCRAQVLPRNRLDVRFGGQHRQGDVRRIGDALCGGQAARRSLPLKRLDALRCRADLLPRHARSGG